MFVGHSYPEHSHVHISNVGHDWPWSTQKDKDSASLGMKFPWNRTFSWDFWLLYVWCVFKCWLFSKTTTIVSDSVRSVSASYLHVWNWTLKWLVLRRWCWGCRTRSGCLTSTPGHPKLSETYPCCPAIPWLDSNWFRARFSPLNFFGGKRSASLMEKRYSAKNKHSPWKMMLRRRFSFWNGRFFRGRIRFGRWPLRWNSEAPNFANFGIISPYQRLFVVATADLL